MNDTNRQYKNRIEHVLIFWSYLEFRQLGLQLLGAHGQIDGFGALYIRFRSFQPTADFANGTMILFILNIQNVNFFTNGLLYVIITCMRDD